MNFYTVRKYRENRVIIFIIAKIATDNYREVCRCTNKSRVSYDWAGRKMTLTSALLNKMLEFPETNKDKILEIMNKEQDANMKFMEIIKYTI